VNIKYLVVLGGAPADQYNPVLKRLLAEGSVMYETHVFDVTPEMENRFADAVARYVAEFRSLPTLEYDKSSEAYRNAVSYYELLFRNTLGLELSAVSAVFLNTEHHPENSRHTDELCRKVYDRMCTPALMMDICTDLLIVDAYDFAAWELDPSVHGDTYTLKARTEDGFEIIEFDRL
jgi:hypothetical protein